MVRKPLAVGAFLLALVAAVMLLPGMQFASAPGLAYAALAVSSTQPLSSAAPVVNALSADVGLPPAGPPVERLVNGGFEQGFFATSLGPVGNGWQPFVSGGGAEYGFYQDTWAPVVHEGTNSQLIAISTLGQSGEGAPHYSGIYQTVAVVPGTPYKLAVFGMIRALEDDPNGTNGGYGVQYGVDLSGGTSWQAVADWVDVPWDAVYPRLAPGPVQSYGASVEASGEKLTLYLRVVYKWETANREVDVNLDGVSLKGPMPSSTAASGKSYTVVTGSGSSAVVVAPGNGAARPTVSLVLPKFPVASCAHKVQVLGKSDIGIVRVELYDGGALLGRTNEAVGPLQLPCEFDWHPSKPGRHTLKAVAYDPFGGKAEEEVVVTVGRLGQFLSNGSFEEGFAPSGPGVVGSGWSPFHSGGRAQYGFYDETWIPVVYDGLHSQLIEINTWGHGGTDTDRIAGIYQTVDRLTPGAEYRLTLRGLLRVRAGDSDREGYNYRIQWGYTLDDSSDWTLVTNWAEVPWDMVYTRLDPGEMSEHVATFEAPASRITLFVRAWKKWGTMQRELDVNLDGLRLEGYEE